VSAAGRCGCFHNSAIDVRCGEPGGPRVVHVHRKMFLPTYGVFDEERFLTRGRRLSTFETPFGPVQVQIALSGGKILDVQALQLPSDRSRSARISQYSAPILRSEAIQAQSARVDIVSGATYTSRAYAQSLASALKQAGQ